MSASWFLSAWVSSLWAAKPVKEKKNAWSIPILQGGKSPLPNTSAFSPCSLPSIFSWFPPFFHAGPLAAQDLHLAAATCQALQRLMPAKKDKFDKTPPVRFAQDHAMVEAACQLLESTFASSVPGWIPGAEQALNAIYALAEHPDALADRLLRRANMEVFATPQNSAQPADRDSLDHLMTKLLFLVGHVALRQLVHAEAVLSELKRRRTIQEEQSHKQKQHAAAQRKKTASEEDDMGVGGASAEDTDAEFIQAICERELVLHPAAILSTYTPLIEAVCRAPMRFQNMELQCAAVLALTKFMCTSSIFCEEHLQVLFTVLRTSPHAQVRSNAIISLGDLAFRFPNLLEPWTAHLYSP